MVTMVRRIRLFFEASKLCRNTGPRNSILFFRVGMQVVLSISIPSSVLVKINMLFIPVCFILMSGRALIFRYVSYLLTFHKNEEVMTVV